MDTSVIPPAYTISFDDDPETCRDTDRHRLRPVAASQDKHLDSQGLKCPAPCCQSIITAAQLQVWEVLFLCLPVEAPTYDSLAMRKDLLTTCCARVPAPGCPSNAMNRIMAVYLVQHDSHTQAALYLNHYALSWNLAYLKLCMLCRSLQGIPLSSSAQLPMKRP